MWWTSSDGERQDRSVPIFLEHESLGEELRTPLIFCPVQFDIMNNVVALAAGSLAVLLSHEDGE